MPTKSDINQTCVGYFLLRIHHDSITFHQHQISFGYNHGAIALYHNYEGLTGNIQIPDSLAILKNKVQNKMVADTHADCHCAKHP